MDGHPGAARASPAPGAAGQLHCSHTWRSGTAEGGTCASCSLLQTKGKWKGAGQALHSKPFLQEQFPPGSGLCSHLTGIKSKFGQRHLPPEPHDLPVHQLHILPHQALLDIADVGEEVAHCCDPGPAGRGNVVVIPRIPQHDAVLAGPGEAAQSTFPAGKGKSTSAIQWHHTGPAIQPPGEMEVRDQKPPPGQAP